MGKASRILLVEPNMVNRKLISGLLEKAGYDVDMLDPAALATDTAPVVDDRAALVLIDGQEYQEALSAGFGRLPVIVMVDDAQSPPENIDPHHILYRPISPETLSEKVKAALAAPPTKNQKSESETLSAEEVMRLTLDLCADHITTSAEGPFAAVITRNGKIIAKACDQVRQSGDPTAKAALLAIRSACENLHSPLLGNCEIYLSCEPCPLSLAAIYEAGLDRIYYAMPLEDMEGDAYDYRPLYDQMALPADARTMPSIAMLEDEGRIVLEQWKTVQLS